MSLGQMVNEIVMNFSKHAFGASDAACIVLRIDHDEEARTAVLSIGDNGRGMEPDTAEGIGPQMIRALARQLDAETTQSAPPRRAARRWT